jgi:hypothetical protein
MVRLLDGRPDSSTEDQGDDGQSDGGDSQQRHYAHEGCAALIAVAVNPGRGSRREARAVDVVGLEPATLRVEQEAGVPRPTGSRDRAAFGLYGAEGVGGRVIHDRRFLNEQEHYPHQQYERTPTSDQTNLHRALTPVRIRGTGQACQATPTGDLGLRATGRSRRATARPPSDCRCCPSGNRSRKPGRPRRRAPGSRPVSRHSCPSWTAARTAATRSCRPTFSGKAPAKMFTSPGFAIATSVDYAELNSGWIVRAGNFNKTNRPNGSRVAFFNDGGANWFQGAGYERAPRSARSRGVPLRSGCRCPWESRVLTPAGKMVLVMRIA